MNPFELICDMAEVIVDTVAYNEELRRQAIKEERKQKQLIKQAKKENERLKWEEASKAERENPDEWRVLPYGWSPFGLYL